MKKKTFVMLMIFALVWPFLHLATTLIWAKLFSLTFEHLQPLKFFVWGIIVGGPLFYAFLGIFVFKTFRRQYLFLTFSLFWILLGIVLNFSFGFASFYLASG